MKHCKHCGQDKSDGEFYVIRKSGPDRLDSRCKPCKRIYDARPACRLSRFKAELKNVGKYTCDLELAEYTELLSKPCEYCSGPLSELGRGIDRKDSAGNYTTENVVPSCSLCNEVKGVAFTYLEMKLIGPLLAKIQASRKLAGISPAEGYCTKLGKRKVGDWSNRDMKS